MRRRDFIKGIVGSTAAWPLNARGQQAALPVIGFLVAAPALVSQKRMIAFRQGLAELGYVEGKNISIVSVGADSKYDRLPTLAAELVRRRVSLIVSPQSSVAAIAARDTTKIVPIVFSVVNDPVELGLVASLERPGGNVTGVTNLSDDVMGKRIGLVRELLPNSKRVAFLVNPTDPASKAPVREAHVAAGAFGLEVHVINANTNSEIDAAFAKLARERPDALLVIPDALFSSRNRQIVLLAARHMLPAIYSQREYADVGGLMSYGTSLGYMYRQMGVYTGRILKGAKPADLPVVRATRFEFVINLKAASALSLTVPPTLLARADAVID